MKIRYHTAVGIVNIIKNVGSVRLNVYSISLSLPLYLLSDIILQQILILIKPIISTILLAVALPAV